jgi:PAS domain S-box-containing protein
MDPDPKSPDNPGRDIADMKKVQDILQASETRYRHLFETAQDGILILDADIGQIVDVNTFLIDLLGSLHEGFLGKKIWEIGHFKDIIANKDHFEELRQKEYIRYEDRPLETADGRHIDVEFVSTSYTVDNKKVIQCRIRDNTGRKRAEEALAASELRYRRLFETTNDGILILDGDSGQIIDVNPFLIDLLGFSREQFLQKKIWEIGLSRDIVANKAHFEELQRKESSRYEDRPLETADGRHIDVEIVSNVYSANNKKVVQCNIRDITERKKVEEALLRSTNKLAMINSITRHDILNQLMGLTTYLELSKEDVTDPVFRGYIQKEDQAAEAILGQIEFTRDYQDIGTQAPKWQILFEIISSAIQKLKPQKIELNVNVRGVGVFADPLMEKVFYNLMENSLRHGDHVTNLDYSVRETADGLIITYCDDGVGITAEDKKKLFQKGFGKHTGLGLFLSQEILSITGITITENGELGKGVRFEILVPKGAFRFADQ